MNQLRKEVRTLSLRQPRYFDERSWPTDLALVLWAGGAAALSVTADGWRDPRPWVNTWVQLIAIGVALAAALWAVRAMSPRVQQRIKLCLVLSLAFHTALATALAYYDLRPFSELAKPEQLAVVEARVLEESPPEVIVQPPPVGDERREIEKPLATGTPRLEQQELAEERAAADTLEAIRQTHDVAVAEPKTGPQLARLERPDMMPTLRADTAGRRSRRESSPAEPTTSPAESIAASSPAAARRRFAPSPALSDLARAIAVAPMTEPSSEVSATAREVVEERTLPRPAVSTPRPEETVASVPRPRIPDEPAHIRDQRIAHQPTEATPEARPAPQLQAQRDALERATPTAPDLTTSPADARPQQQTTASVAMLPRQPLLMPLPRIARDSEPSREERRVEIATLPELEATTRELAELSVTQSQDIAQAQPTSTQLSRQSSNDLPSTVELPSAAEMASSPRAVAQATPTRIAQADVPSVHSDRSDAARSREEGHVAQLATSGSEQIRDVPTPTAALGQGGGQPTSAGLLADTQSVPLARSATAIVAPEAHTQGAPSTTSAGRLAERVLPERRRAATMTGLQSGGSAVRPRQSNEVVASTSPTAALPSQLTAPQAGASVAESETAAAERAFAVPSDASRSSAPLPSTIVADQPIAPTGARSPAVPAGRLEPPTAAAGAAGTSTREPTVAGATDTAMPRQQTSQAAPLPGSAQIAELPATTPDRNSSVDRAGVAESGDRMAASPLSLGRSTSIAPVVTEALEGDGGLGPVPSQVVGLPDRRASRDAQLAHAVPPRLIRKSDGGTAGIDGAARVPAAAFANRGRRLEEPNVGGAGRPSAKTEAAIELGLEFLARVQLDDGHWSFGHLGNNVDFNPDGQPSLRADAAATGLALLAFLGAGYDHFEDKYDSQVQKALHYLIRIQADSGELFPEAAQSSGAVTRFYGHGIAALALCEAFGMTGDAELREPAQRALDYIAETQHPEHGGWRYVPGVNSDLSVTGWQLMALRSGQLAGLSVRPETFERVQNLVESCRGDGANQVLFRYNPWASATDPRTRHGRRPSTVMTAVGLLSQLYLGSNRDDETMQRGADHLLKNLPMHGNSPRLAPTGTLVNPLRDTYYWYYATQVMFHMGGEYWTAWNDRLHPLLVDTQTPVGPLAGSWNPRQPVPDKWGSFGGRLYVSTMNLLSLEVYYRHLPLYEMTAQ